MADAFVGWGEAADGYPIGMRVRVLVAMAPEGSGAVEVLGEVVGTIVSSPPERLTVSTMQQTNPGEWEAGEETYSSYGQWVRAEESGPVDGLDMRGSNGFCHLAWIRPADSIHEVRV